MRNREGWEVKKIGEFLEQIRGVSYKPSDLGQEETDSFIPLLRANNIQNELVFEDLNFVHISKVKDVQLIKEGDILVCTSSGSKHLVGKAAQASRDLNMTFGAFCKIIRPKNINSDFLGFYFKSNIYRQKISEFSRGANINNIKTEHIDSLQIPIPPRDIQHQIVSELDTLNSIIDKKKEQLNELDNLAQATFYDMFGDPVENEKGWEKVPFNKVMTLKRGYDLPIQDRIDGNVPIMASNGVLGSHNIHKVKGPGVVTGRSGTLGLVHYVQNDYWPLNTALYVQKMNGNNPIYLLYLLKTFDLKRFSRGAGVPTLNRNLVHAEKIIETPLPLQTQFAEKIKHIEQQKALIQRSIDDVQQLFDYTMDKYFN